MRIVRMPISKNYDWKGLRPYMTTDNNGEPEENCPFCEEVSKEWDRGLRFAEKLKRLGMSYRNESIEVKMFECFNCKARWEVWESEVFSDDNCRPILASKKSNSSNSLKKITIQRTTPGKKLKAILTSKSND